MVEFIHGIVALLAGVILVLTATVAWLYIQQSRMMHAINSLAVAVTAPPPSFMMHAAAEPPPETEPEHEQEAEQQPLVDEVHEIDDRVSVHEVDAAPAAEAHAEASAEAAPAHDDAIESVQGKTIAQLREMLTAKGIPFNKSDKKPTLISLVQISA
jgi:hypothetical protein